ncbi:RodZ family helix-turn-helix domain-containing protein [Limnohabitans sp. DM1]|uniref:helix-turn-helix domain-containing protein n=1 Tax=Limnohabitans sp. DM1 TaxID=1597955 RepID=UPI000A621937|nr:helix-turn-helix domain-containing protein [Limnohabitans sp. DM1]
MSTPNSDRVRGELLREWRLAQQIELSDLARRVNLSAAQVQQLESGGSSLFYSEPIKYSAARKVAKALGQDPESVIRTIANEGVSADPAMISVQVLDDLIQLSEQRKSAQQESSGGARRFVRWFLWWSGLLVLGALATGLYLQPEPITHWATEQWARVQSYLAPAPATQLPAPAVLTEASDAQLAAEAAVPEASVSTPADMAALASAVPVNSASTPALPVSVAAPAVALALPESLCQSTEQGTLLTSKIPSKAGDMVYIVPLKAGSVCAKDGTGKSTVLTLQAKEGRSVYGPPPWRVYFEHTDQAQVYFQGERLRWPEVPTRAIVLREVKPQ